MRLKVIELLLLFLAVSRADDTATDKRELSTRFEVNKEFKNWSESIVRHPKRTYLPSTMNDLIRIVKEAKRLGRRVHAVGAGWSFDDVMYTNDFLVDTTAMAGVIAFSQGRNSWRPYPSATEFVPRILPDALRESVLNSDRRLVDVYAGTSLKTLIDELDRPSRNAPHRGQWALPTMGGASGQTLAGAINTGTHGGHFNEAPVADMVQAIYLIGPDGRPHWIERGGNRAICDPSKLKRLTRLTDDTIHQDDEWFRTALVSLGNLGIVVNYIIEVREQYGVSEAIHETTWRDLAPMLESGEIFTSTRYSQRNRSRRWIDAHPVARDRVPASLSIFINPYRISDNYETDRRPDRTVLLSSHATAGHWNGRHVPPAGASIFDQMHLIKDFESAGNLPACRSVIQRVINNLRSSSGTGNRYRLAHSVFDTTNPEDRTPILSIGIVVTTEGNRHVRMINRLLEIFDKMIADYWKRGIKAKFAGGFNLRFTKPTEAYLGMQSATSNSRSERFCHIEVVAMRELWFTGKPLWGPGSDYSKNDMENYSEVFTDAFERATDAFGARLHWGQLSRTNRHDPDKYDGFPKWLDVKSALTNDGAYRTFENDFSVRHLSFQRRIALRAHNGKYLVAEGGGGREIMANRPFRNEWETFKLIELGGDKVALRADSGHYLTAEGGGGGKVVANVHHIRGWETFHWKWVGWGKAALRAYNGQYVVAENGGGGPILANRNRIGIWETFSVEFL